MMTWAQTLFLAAPLWSISADVARRRTDSNAERAALLCDVLSGFCLFGFGFFAWFGL